MHIFRHYRELSGNVRHGVVALGNFDGIHRGHQAVIDSARKRARALDVPVWVMSFEPHPRLFFDPEQPPFLLTPFRVKASLFEQAGVDFLLLQQFDATFAAYSPEKFAREVLADSLKAQHVVVGENYSFGHGREGKLGTLQTLGEKFGFTVETVPPVCLDDGTLCSSTHIRNALRDGDIRRVTRFLGRYWEIEGRVEHGKQLGRILGFPTANVRLSHYQHPALGVYAALVAIDKGPDPRWYSAVVNIGTRPTFGKNDPLVEVHLLNFEGDLYGSHLRIDLVDYLRPEQRFPNLDSLKLQISHDAETALHLLKHPLSVVGSRTS